MKIMGPMLAFFWGIGQNLPVKYEHFYLAGIGPGDMLFLGFLLFSAVYPPARTGFFQSIIQLRGYLCLIVAFVVLTLISSFINMFIWGLEGRDLVEIFRPLYYFLMVAYIATYTKRNGSMWAVMAFLSGILLSGIIAYLNPSQTDVWGFPVLWNPNVVGNILAIGIVLASLLILSGRFLPALFFVSAFVILAVFTYSKGTWLMSLLGLIACLVAALSLKMDRHSRMMGKLVFILGIVGILAMGVQNYDTIYEIVISKLLHTQFGDSASDGGTFAARYGFARASLQIALENPLTGVGISNFGLAYDNLSGMLGADYWETDNPHSAWLYVLACIGFPGLAVLVLLVLYPIRQLAASLELRPMAKILYIGCVSAVFFISGAVVLHILTQYFLWFFTGVMEGSRWSVGSPTTSTDRDN